MERTDLDKPKNSLLYLSILVLYLLSGLVGLAYEILWAKSLSLLFGVSIFGIAITVSAFLTGLGVGSLLAYRFIEKISRPLLALGLIELFVALFSFFLPVFLKSLDSSILGSDLSVSGWQLVQAIVTFVILFLPACLLGMGFTLLLRFFSDKSVSLGWIYGANTLGGVLGVLLPLLLLPVFGWTVSLRLIAILGLSIGLLFIVHSIRDRGNVSGSAPRKTAIFSNSRNQLLAYSLVGFSSLMLQMAWTRFYGMIFLRTEYVLAIIIAIFLLGISLGSFLSKKINFKSLVSILPFLIAVFAMLSLLLLPLVSELNSGQVYRSHSEALFSQAILLLVITLPVTLILGLWYPYLSRSLSLNTEQSVVLYSVNSIGSGLGALIAVFVLIPLFDSAAIIGISAGLFLLSGIIWMADKRLRLFAISLSIFCFAFSLRPEVSSLMPESYKNSSDIFFHENAIAATHVVEKKSGERLLLNDLQRMDASSDYSAVQAQRNQSRLPYFLHPDPKSFLFLGLGTGISVSGISELDGLEIDVVELSEGAITSAKSYFDKANHDVMSKVNVIEDDARRYLRFSPDVYDVIVGDLFHPDLVGRGNLLSIQQFSQAHSRLEENGLFVQWLALNQFDVSSLEVVLRTFSKVFPDHMLFIDGFRLALVGYRSNIPAYAALNAKLNSEVHAHLGEEGLLTWLSRYVGRFTSSEGLVQDDWHPILEYQLPNIKFQKELPLTKVIPYVFNLRPTFSDFNAMMGFPVDHLAAAERAYFATEMFYQSVLAGLKGNAEQEFSMLKAAFEANPNDRWISFRVADQLFANAPSDRSEREFLQKVIDIRPDHIEALRKLGELEKREGNLSISKQVKNRILTLDPYYLY